LRNLPCYEYLFFLPLLHGSKDAYDTLKASDAEVNITKGISSYEASSFFFATLISLWGQFPEACFVLEWVSVVDTPQLAAGVVHFSEGFTQGNVRQRG